MNLRNRQQLLGLLAAAAVVLYATNKLLVDPLTSSWKARTAQIAQLRKQVIEGRGLQQREQSLRARWEQMRTNTLPNSPSIAEQQVLKAFDRWSQESRISILSISPQLKHDTEDYMTLECRVEAAGNLNTVSRFLYDLEKDPMALKLQSVEINARDMEGQQLALGLQVSALVLTPQEHFGAKSKAMN